MRTRSRFTLIELMIAIGIAAVLASFAMPQYHYYKIKVARSELETNVSGIKVAQQAYDAAHNGYLSESTPRPTATLGKTKRPWETGTGFEVLGWAPNGLVFGSYATTDGGTDFTADGYTDVDKDTNYAHAVASKAVNAKYSTGNDIF